MSAHFERSYLSVSYLNSKTAKKLTSIQNADFPLYFKVSKLSHDSEFKMIKINGDGKISANDMVWPKIRFMLKQLKEKTEKLDVS